MNANPKFYFRAGVVATEDVKPSYRFLVNVPGTTGLALTSTYAAQISLGDMALKQYNGSDYKVKADQLTPLLISQIGTKIEDELNRVQLQLRILESEVRALNGSSATRAQLFTDFFGDTRKPAYETSAKILAGKGLTGKDADSIGSAVYDVLRGKGIPARLKRGISDFIMKGTVNLETLSWLAETGVNPNFEKLVEYAALNNKLQQMRNGHNTDFLGGLDQYVEAVISWQAQQQEVDLDGGLKINIYQMVRQLLDAELKRQFLCTIDEVIEGENKNGSLSLFHFHYKASGPNVPEGLKPYYHPPERIAQLLAILEEALGKIVSAYAVADEVLLEHIGSINGRGLFMRSLMPENSAVKAFYPDEMVSIPGNPALTKQIAEWTYECFTSGLMADLAANKLGMDEVELRQGLERLVSILDKALPVLPLKIYELVATTETLKAVRANLQTLDQKIGPIKTEIDRARDSGPLGIQIQQLAREYKTLVAAYNPLVRKNNNLLDQLREIIKQLQSDFGIDTVRMLQSLAKYDDTTLNQAIELFGEENVGFIRKVLTAGNNAT